MRTSLLGLPQSGKRALFTLLTGRSVPESRKPGECIEGVTKIRDPRVDVLARIFEPRKVTYAENNIVLCPDLIEGAPTHGWLDTARRSDLLCLVLRAFESETVYHAAGSVEPERDRCVLEAELILTDLEVVLNRLLRIGKEKKSGRASAAQLNEERVLTRCAAALEESRPLHRLALGEEERAAIRSLRLVTLRPFLWVHNVAEDAVAAPQPPGSLAVSCKIEEEIAAIEEPSERAEFLAALGLSASGLDRLNAAAYDAQGLMSFYTTGKDEVRAWTIRKGSRAPEAGGKIHSDIERGFIRVEIIKYDDIVAAGSERAAKDQGRVQLKGKDYIIEDGDTCHFLFNV
jgi:GTP-binding protein YchF